LQSKRRVRDHWFIAAMILEENVSVRSVPEQVVSALLWHEKDNK
jgi:hypothetical protein